MIIHELGHLFFGLISGYHLLYIKILGITIEKTDVNGLRIRFYRKGALGQCMMYPKRNTTDSYPNYYIIGGILFNTLFGIVFIIMAIILKHVFIKMLFLAWGSINIYLAVFNMFLGSETSDGKTFMEVIREEKNREYYNRLMIIYKYLKEGKKYSDMPEELFVIIEDLKDSQYCIKREMYMHRINYLTQNKGRT